MATFLAAAGVDEHLIIRSMASICLAKRWNETFTGGWCFAIRRRCVPVWKYLSIDGAEFLYDLSRDERERANMRYREPEKFEELRRAFFDWDASMPPRPHDAAVALEYTPETMARSDG